MAEQLTSFACWLNTGNNHLTFAIVTTLVTTAIAFTGAQVLP